MMSLRWSVGEELIAWYKCTFLVAMAKFQSARG